MMSSKIFKNLFLFSLFLLFIFNPYFVLAAGLRISVESSSFVAGAKASYVINVTSSTPSSVKYVVITFPNGFNISRANLGSYSPVNGESSPSLSISGQVATITFGNPSNPSTATYSFPINGVVNPKVSSLFYITAETKDADFSTIDGPASSRGFNMYPAPISDLSCETNDQQAGSVWLYWTTPAGVSEGYEVKYQEGNSISYENALTFEQNWPSGVIGVYQRQLVTGLNPKTQYTFAMRSFGDGHRSSDISTLTPTCYAGSGSKTVIDTQPPVTQIVFPAMNSTVSVNEPLVIKGSSMDKGGSSVQMVEVSLDDGITWNKADIVIADDGNRIWQYTWARPSVGTRKVLVRASDWMGNVESPAVSVTFTVGTVTSPITPSLATTTQGLTTPALSGLPYANPVGADQIQANLTYLREQLLALLQQLLILLQAQLR